MPMFRRFIPTLSVSLAALLALSEGASALTAEDVWKAWQDAAVAGDHPLTASAVDVIPDGIRIRGLRTSLTMGSRELGIELDQVTLERKPDDTVSVSLSEKPSILISSGDRQARLSVESQDLKAKVSGVPGSLSHELLAERAQIHLDASEVNGEGDLPIELLLDLGGLSAQLSQLGALDAEASVAVASLDATFSAGNTATGRDIAAKLHMESIASTASLHDFVDVDLSNLGPRIQEGAEASAKAEIAKTGYEVELRSGSDSDQTETLTGVLGVSSFEIGLAPAGLRTRIAATGVEASSKGFGIPPASGTLGGLALALDLPLFPGEEAAPAALTVSLDKIAPSAAMWGLFDSSSSLDHSPFVLNVDVVGLVKPLRNLLQLPPPEGEGFPLEVSSVDLKRVMLQALGGTAEAKGTLQFDEKSKESMFGLPLPEGAVDMTVSGLDSVLASLSAANLIGEGEVDAAKFFMALFLKPTEVEGTFTTRIEASEDGEVLANGQRIR